MATAKWPVTIVSFLDWPVVAEAASRREARQVTLDFLRQRGFVDPEVHSIKFDAGYLVDFHHYGRKP